MRVGEEVYRLAGDIFPIARSITGKGVLKTFEVLNAFLKNNNCPEFEIHDIASGTQVFDWNVPKEWEINEAYIENEKGEKIISFADHPLHVVGYSTPVDRWVDLEELKQYIYVQEDVPYAIPYVTSYYKERYGFCMSMQMRDSLPEGKYHMYIDSRLFDGKLTYGDLVIPGSTEKEVLFSSYVCHPHMANNEASGPALICELIKYVCAMKNRKYTYRFVLVPETIGSIVYLSRNLDHLKKNVKAGFVISCVGDNDDYSIVESKYADTYADMVLSNVLDYLPHYTRYSFLKRGSDERQYNAPGIDMPVVGFSRTKYVTYKYYHTSKDDMSYISPEGFDGSYEVVTKVIDLIENNGHYRLTCLCESQLGKRGLYPTISKRGSYDAVQSLRDFIAYADGKHDLIEMSGIIGIPAYDLIPIKNKLMENDLLVNLDECNNPSSI